jgi:UDP-N-acetylmuramate dehydrogenase
MKAVLGDIQSWFAGKLRFNEPLAHHVSLKVGGPADLLATPETRDELQQLVLFLDQHRIPRFILGGGFNLLPADEGFRGCAISLKRINRLQLLENGVTIEAGATNIALARAVVEVGLSGLEFLIGIPGTVGGALRMNAGAHGSDIFRVVKSLTLLQAGQCRELQREELDYGYRRLTLPDGALIVAARLQLQEDTPQAIRARMDEYLGLRWATQNVGFPNAGSFFKNPSGHSAWRLIDQAGLRGFSIGNAQVSEVHTNFLVNKGNATATDFLTLADEVKKKVKVFCGIELEEEVQLLGNGECGP